MFRLALALCLALVPALAYAQAAKVAILLPNVPGQSYTVTTDGKGGAIVVPLAGVVDPTDLPDPPDPPTGPVLTPFEKEIQSQTKAVLDKGGTKTTGAALSEVYSRVSAGVANGTVDHAQALAAVKAGSNLVLAEMPDSALWATWRTSVGESLTKLQQDGDLTTKAQYASALRQVANGLNAATGYTNAAQKAVATGEPGKGILDGIDIAKIIELIKLIMELLKLFKGV